VVGTLNMARGAAAKAPPEAGRLFEREGFQQRLKLL